MLIRVFVKPGQHADRLWRSEAGLVAYIRAAPHDGQANAHLIRFVAGSLRVPQSLVSIRKGQSSPHKTLSIQVPEADLKPQLDRLAVLAQNSLFSE
jgi:uncharacterized protein YggU (UPF0235/DUF167 family)